jgi:hypothetical protein
MRLSSQQANQADARQGLSGQWRVKVEFEVQPSTEVLRPEATQRKPRTGGPESALVVGPSSGQAEANLHTDALGRIKIQFPWDRYGQKNANSSCWVRVASAWAGNQLGAMHLPRVGQEVIVIQGPARGTQPAYSLAVEFEDSDNPRKNIHHYQLLVDGLTRVHPGGYAALFNAAIDNGVDRIVVTSCWRPMLGSIAHRLGLGLDVNFVGGVRLNRQELKTGRATYQDADDNVSTEERILYREMKAAEEERRRAQKKAGAEAEKAKGGGNDSTKKVANAELKAAREKEVAAKKDWDAERNKHEPPKVRAFRSSLLSCACVGQLFDPWYMFDNTASAGFPNRQETANEITHAHHLHITVKDKKVFVP